MKRHPHFCLIAIFAVAALLQSSCAMLPSVPLPWLNFSASNRLGIQHMNIGVRGVLSSSKLKHVIIESIKEGSAASQAGIISGDAILSIDDAKIASLSASQFRAMFAAFEHAAPGRKIVFEVQSRADKVTRRTEVVLPPKSPSKAIESMRTACASAAESSRLVL